MRSVECKWKCCECGGLYSGEESASDCCRPEIREVYICPECGDDHNRECHARECCPDEDAPSDEHTAYSGADRIELERAGQLRLIE
jgi:hypothetical protein